MDLIIEAIVWLMRALFGEPEKPADPSKFPSNQPRRARGERRGPYVYGDEPAAQQGKTLEQILEEVRREALERRQGGAPRPAAAVPQEEEPERRRTLVEELESKERKAPAHTPKPGHMLDVDALPSERGAARHTLEVAPPPPTSIPTREAPAPIAVTETVQTIGTIRPAADELSERQAEAPRRKKRRRAPDATPSPTAAPVGSSLHLLHAIRSAPSGEKARFAREALVIFEVFSAPRSRRPYRPGARVI